MEYKDYFKHLEEDYPPTWNLETFIALQSFKKRIEYCNEHLERLASGSSRVVYKIDNEKVLKLAKNRKGIAQNSVERDGYVQRAYESIVAKVYETDKNDLWLEMELASYLYPKRFELLLGFTINDLSNYLYEIYQIHNGNNNIRRSAELEEMEENDWVIEIQGLMMEMNMPPGDLGRISSYGEVIRDNKPAVVIIDCGLTEQVYTDFYKTN